MSSKNIVMGAAGASTVIPDPNFKNVSLLLSGDGTNGAQNNTFLDSSTNNFTITRNGNTTQGSFSPYGSLWSNYFDGTGDFLTLSDNAAWDLSGDYTIECWFYITSTPNSPTLIQIGSSSDFLILYLSAGTLKIDTAGSLSLTSSIAINLNTWNHVALVRNGTGTNNTVMYINGAVAGQTTNNVSFTGNATVGVRIGAEYPTDYLVNGNISNVRIVNGSAVYTSAFTPSTTPLTAVTNTALLTCQANRIIDSSVNNFAVTKNGDVSVQRFSPFNPTSTYDTSLIGGSGYFDGSGDYLTVADNANLRPGSGDFTIALWIYPTASISSQIFAFKGTGSDGFIFQSRSSGGGSTLSFWVANAGSPIAQGSSLTLNEWNHVAVTRSGSTVTIYKNGVSVATGSNSTNFSNTAVFYVGGDGSSYSTGYITDLQLIIGSAVTTVPTTPQTAVLGTQLLLSYKNAGIPDLAMMNDLETVGNAQVSTSVKKYGTGSLAFDGTGDWLQQPLRPVNTFGSSDFTIEFWLYPNNVSTPQYIYSMEDGTYYSLAIAISGTGKLNLNLSSNGTSVSLNLISTTTLSTSTWYHVAYTRSGTTVTSWLNGNSDATGTFSGAIYTTANPVTIGARGQFPSATIQFFNGNIDDLRITKGLARYTANFTPPALALSTQ